MKTQPLPPIQLPLANIPLGIVSRPEAAALFAKLKADVAKLKDGGGRCYGRANQFTK